MTASAVSSGGAPPAGASASPRAKGGAANADQAFAQVLAGIDGGGDATEGAGDGGGIVSDLFAAWSAPGATGADSIPPEPAVPIDVVTPGEGWTTLTMAWTTATSVDPVDVSQPDVALPAATTASVGFAGTTDVMPADAAQTMPAPITAAPTAQRPAPAAVGTPSVPEAADVSGAQPSDVAPAEGTQMSTDVKAAPGAPIAWTPSSEPAASSGQVAVPGWRERNERADDALAEAAVAEAPVPAARAAAPDVSPTVAAISDAPVAATAVREPERLPAPPEAQAAVVVPSSVRAALDATPATGMDAAAPATSDTAAAVVDQVVKSMRLQWKNGLGEARIQLRPEHLGPVDISIKVDRGSITAVVRAESSQVQDWILSHQQSLRQQLEAAGLRLDALVVSPDAERRRQGDQAEARQQSASRRRRHDGPAPIFEVIV